MCMCVCISISICIYIRLIEAYLKAGLKIGAPAASGVAGGSLCRCTPRVAECFWPADVFGFRFYKKKSVGHYEVFYCGFEKDSG